jgi:hypothetical protein
VVRFKAIALYGAAGMIEKHKWWERRGFVLAFSFAFALPLLWPEVPPLADLPGHMGRYFLSLHLADIPALQRWYGFDWSLIGNLGVDLLMLPLGKLLGVELATKLIVMAIAPLTVLGFLSVSRASHGRLPATAFLATPLAFAYPFQFGFVNFALGVALAFLAFALWMRSPRVWVFALIAPALWLVHVYGWAVLCVLAFSHEMASCLEARQSLGSSIRTLIARCWPLATPILLMGWTVLHSASGGPLAEDWFNWTAKFVFLVSPLRDHWMAWDLGAVLVMLSAILFAVRAPQMRVEKGLAIAALIFLLLFFLMPRAALGSVLADMRLVPVAFACALLSLRPSGEMAETARRWVALGAIGFALLRLAGTTASFAIYDSEMGRELAAIEAIPKGASMVTLIGNGSEPGWSLPRNGHLASMALIRKQAFADDQFIVPGQQALRLIQSPSKGFGRDPDQYAFDAATMTRRVGEIELGVGKVDTLWIIDDPRGPPPVPPGMHAVWRDRASAVFLLDPKR